jgi:hypothetical protein
MSELPVLLEFFSVVAGENRADGVGVRLDGIK